MTGRKKIFTGLTVLAVLLLVFFLSLNYLASAFINLEFVKKAIWTSFSRQTGGTIEYRSIDVSLLPSAHAVIRKINISLTGRGGGTAEKLDLYPEILPLFRGKLLFNYVRIESPDFGMTLSPRPDNTDAEHVNLTFDRIKDSMLSVASYFTGSPALGVEIKDGKFSLTEADMEGLILRDIQAIITYAPRALDITVSGLSGIGEDISIRARLNPEDMDGSGEIQLKRFHLEKFAGYLFPGKVKFIGDSQADLTVRFGFEGLVTFNADVQGSLSRLTLLQGDRKLVIKGRDLKGSYRVDHDGIKATLEELKLDYPRLDLAGNFLMNRTKPGIKLDIEGKDVDVHSLRETALILKDIAPVTGEIFSIVKGGRIPGISYKGEGRSFDDLGNKENYVVSGQMQEGEIVVPAAGIDLTDVNGDVVISKGILNGTGLKAALGNSLGRDGTLRIGLGGKDAPFHLDIMLDADLAQVLSLLKGLIKNGVFAEELSLIESLEGRAAGRLVLGESLKSIRARVDASDINFSSADKRVPFPLGINSGRFYYDESGVKAERLNGNAGKSFFSDIDFQINLQKTPFLNISSGKATIFMDEVYPWLSGLINLPEKSGIRSPLSLSKINVLWDKGDETSLKGNLALLDGPGISFDIYSGQDEFNVNNLAIHDDESDGRLTLNLTKDDLFIKFAGNINHTTVDRIISDNSILRGSVKGDFNARVVRDHPYRFVANGTLEGSGINSPLKQEGPLDIKGISLDAINDKVKIIAADMTLGGRPFNLKGDVSSSDDKFLIDTTLTTGELEWEKLKSVFSAAKEDEKTGPLFEFPVRGFITLNSEALKYDKFTFKPFHAVVALDSGNVRVDVTGNYLCGIYLPGSIEFTRRDTSVAFQLLASEENLKYSMKCLWDMERRMTGSYDLNARIAGSGKSEDQWKSLKGDLEFRSREGRIYQGGLLAKILAFINVTEIFRGKVPDLVREGFAYKSMTAKGTLDGQTLTIEEFKMDASNMNMVSEGKIDIRAKTVDLNVLVSPLKTIDFIIRKIPIIRDIIGGTLVSIPIKVTGDIEDPDLKYLPISAVEDRLLNIMKNTLQVPVRIIKPIIPK